MKRIFLLATLFCATMMAFSQAKKPTIMVVPSDNWCYQNEFVQTYDNQGTTVSVSDYSTALQQSLDLKLMISTINSLMAEREFPLKDLEQQMKIVNQQTAELSLTVSKNGNELAETPLDRLMRVAKADIVLELTWGVNMIGPKRQLTYILEAKDSYTGKSIASITGISAPTISADNATLLREAAVSEIDNFNFKLQNYFNDLLTNGREVVFEVRVFAGNEAGVDLETEYDGDELVEIIDRWVWENTQEHRFSKVGGSEYYVQYEQVRIPLYDARGMAYDADMFGRDLRKYLRKEPFNIPSKVQTKGLGRCVLILGEK